MKHYMQLWVMAYKHTLNSFLQCIEQYYPRYGRISAPSLSAKSARICIVDNEILKLASSPRMDRKRSSFDSVGSSTSLS